MKITVAGTGPGSPYLYTEEMKEAVENADTVLTALRTTEYLHELSGLEYRGYEIHMGSQEAEANVINEGNVYGTYLHGIFDSEAVARTIIQTLLRKKGLDFDDVKAFNIDEYKQEQYDRLAAALRQSLDIEAIYRILEK